MKEKNDISQEELDILKVDTKTEIKDDIKNIIILFRNELNTLEKNIEEFPDDLQKKIKKKLNSLLEYIMNIRSKS
jgi:hypothetical protein